MKELKQKIRENYPNKKELVVLNLFYNRFYKLYEEISNDNFFSKEPDIRFNKIKEIFSIYKELLVYEPIKYYLEHIKTGGRPPLEGIIADELFSFIRNLLQHYPIFDNWNKVYITKDLATWNKEGTIHKFLLKCTRIKIDGKGTVHYRIWSHSQKIMTYISINFPEDYSDNKIFLKNIITEGDGIKFSIALMKQILDSQVVGNDKQDIDIMASAYFINKK